MYKLPTDAFKKPIHPLIQKIIDLQYKKAAAELTEKLSKFNQFRYQPGNHEQNSIIFQEGVKIFIELANAHPNSHRQSLFGDPFLGLHYRDQLAEMWNAVSSVKINILQLMRVIPANWHFLEVENELTCLVYYGRQPAEALDKLLQGPTVIDCGIFVQLALWFGIRFLLGNHEFNRCFGRSSFFLTRLVFDEITELKKPFLGNPLFCFLSPEQEIPCSSVSVRYFYNHPQYFLKHPGGHSMGENCLFMDRFNYLFNPINSLKNRLNIDDLLQFLCDEFNKETTEHDEVMLQIYQKNPTSFKKFLGEDYLNYEKIRSKLPNVIDKKIISIIPKKSLSFDLNKFAIWFQKINENLDLSYQPLLSCEAFTAKLKELPFENRFLLDFSKFQIKTPKQAELVRSGKLFCHEVLHKRSRLVLFSGAPGSGKTTIAALAKLELDLQKKRTLWLSEALIASWLNATNGIEERIILVKNLEKMLSPAIDALFLDDINLKCQGQIILTQALRWYAANPGKGLFITSNVEINFDNLAQRALMDDEKIPIYLAYQSPQYINWSEITGISDAYQQEYKIGQSVGAIISPTTWEKNKDQLKHELVPVGDKIRLAQKNFLNSKHKIIALEIKSYQDWKEDEIICDIDQLSRVIHFAHDIGGKIVVLINQTGFDAKNLIKQIKKQLSTEEKGRIMRRLAHLLSKTEENIFADLNPNDIGVEEDTSHSYYNNALFQSTAKRVELRNPLTAQATTTPNESNPCVFFRKGPIASTEFKMRKVNPEAISNSLNFNPSEKFMPLLPRPRMWKR